LPHRHGSLEDDSFLERVQLVPGRVRGGWDGRTGRATCSRNEFNPPRGVFEEIGTAASGGRLVLGTSSTRPGPCSGWRHPSQKIAGDVAGDTGGIPNAGASARAL